MIKVTVLYPASPLAWFDHDYYETVHMPLAISLLGGAIRSVTVERGLNPGAPWPAPTFEAACHFVCDSLEAYQNAFIPHAERLQQDMANYTDIEAIVQIGAITLDSSVSFIATPPRYKLISHALCPYVQRAAIVFTEKSIPFERVDIDLAAKPDWFLAISPLGKTPVLLVDDVPIFESAVICDYLDETTAPQLHPISALERARHRGWIEFGSATLNAIGGFYSAKDSASLSARRDELRAKFATLETQLADGPYFSGQAFSVVDATFGPIFRYFDVFDSIADFGFFEATPKVRAWRAALGARPSVQQAVAPDYAQLLNQFLATRGSTLSVLITQPAHIPA